ncbi:MAG: hypothetical protein AABY15_06700 [Nanoarchaeota archaeon]
MNLPEYKKKVDAIAKKHLGIDVNDIIGDDQDLVNAMEGGEHPMDFVKRIAEKYDLNESVPFPYKKTFKVKAKCTTYSHIEIEAYDVDEANDIAENTDGGDFTSDDEEGGDWEILSDETKEV